MSSNSSFARRLWSARQTLFPAFERKGYHLQFRHGVLIAIMLMAASFTLPANPQTKDFPNSDYSASLVLGIEASYNLIHKHVLGIMYYNIGVAGCIALQLVTEPLLRRGVPVWFEIAWMILLSVGEAVCLGFMIASRPGVCNFSFGPEEYSTSPITGKVTPKSSAMSICSNWKGMSGLLAAIIVAFLLHVTWHMIISIRHISSRRSVFALPITDYRWKLPKELERINETFPGDLEAPPSPVKEGKQPEYSNYTSNDLSYKGTTELTTASDTISFPVTSSVGTYSNYDRPVAAKSTLDTLPARSQPVVLEQSTVTHSDTSSIAESDRAGATDYASLSSSTRDTRAPFSSHR
ncbi:hypothetical protein BDV93DRAFT_524435, partial [Ceratobasidium sp. AG-I]